MLADMDKKLCFPTEMSATNLRPDLVFWSASLKLVYIIELTVPWEDAVEETYERKKLRYTELAAQVQQQSWRAEVHSVEVGCRSFRATATSRLMMRVRGKAPCRTVRDLSRAAEKGELVAVDEEKSLHLGLQVSRWHLGSEPGTLGFTAEPSGGVVGLSVKQ